MSTYHLEMSMPREEEVLRRKKYLEKLIPRLEKKLESAPPGSLMISRGTKDRRPAFYHVLPPEARSDEGRAKARKVYLNREHEALIRELAQKEYCRKLLKTAREEAAALDGVLRYCRLPKVEDVPAMCHEEKRPFLRPVVESDEDFRRRWLEQRFRQNEYGPEQKLFPTARGDLVRSKSESQQADCLFRGDYTYLYEKSLKLTDRGRVTYRYPDFTILDPVTRTEVIYEHFGRMDDPEYRLKALEKIRLYLDNGYVIGKDFLFTYETKDHPFTVDQLDRVLRARFG